MKFFRSNRKKDDFFEILEKEIEETYASREKYVPQKKAHAITPDEVLSNENVKPLPRTNLSPLEALKMRMQNNQNSTDTETQEPKKSLLEKCRPYTVDDHGHDLSAEKLPLYKLESVAEILKSDSKKALDALSKKYNISTEDLTEEAKPSPAPKKDEAVEQVEAADKKTVQRETRPSKTPAFEKMVSDAKSLTDEPQEFDDIFDAAFASDNFAPTPDISDIDNNALQKSAPVPTDTTTIRFTPIKDSANDIGHISVSSITKQIDIVNEFVDENSNEMTATQLEENDFDAFIPDNEIKSIDDAKKHIRCLALKKRSSFLRCVITGFLTFIISLFLLPPLAELITGNTRTIMIICGALFIISVTISIDMLISLKSIFSPKCSPDVLSALSSIALIFLTVISIIENKSAYEMLLIGEILIFIRNLSKFWIFSSTLGNLKASIMSGQKKAVTLISDSSTAFAMAKNAIDGDVLISAPRETDFAEDFIKYSTYGIPLNGKLRYISVLGFLLSVISGIAAYGYFDGIIYSMRAVVTMLFMCSIPTLFFIDALPAFCASKHLNKKGSMIAGKIAAEKLESANAAVLSSLDIFPAGTVTLQSLKVLCDNNVDDTLLRAASLTDAVGSTLAPIFKSIVGTNSSYSVPDSDTVKYEERLGLSGWVDDELLFIGNRTLMEAHGIDVPSIEIDRKILRNGYFPVYVASGGSAYALLIIQYNVDPVVTHELRKLISTGVTLLVDNCDPNINEEMICDYIGLYEDSVKIMTNAGVHMYKNAVTPAKACSAPAIFRGKSLNLITLINCAADMKKSNLLLILAYTVFLVIGTVLFIYTSFSGNGSIPSGMTILMYHLFSSVISLLMFMIKKP